MTNSTSFARRRLVDEIIDHLRSEIESGRVAAGSRLPPEAKLTAQLGVSRTTLREAIVVLSHDGLVDVRQGDGTFVRSASIADRGLASRSVVDLLEAKRPILLGLVRLATGRRTDQEASLLGQLAGALTSQMENGPGDALRVSAAAIESALATAAHSDLLAHLFRQLSAALDASPQLPDAAQLPTEAFEYLARAARGVSDRDAEAADRHTRLWLAAQASALAPDVSKSEYVPPDVRRGPRTSHARRTDATT